MVTNSSTHPERPRTTNNQSWAVHPDHVEPRCECGEPMETVESDGNIPVECTGCENTGELLIQRQNIIGTVGGVLLIPQNKDVLNNWDFTEIEVAIADL